MTRNLKKLSTIVLVLLLFLSLMITSSSAAGGYIYPKIELRANAGFPDNSSLDLGQIKFAEEVSKATNGAITITRYNYDQLAGGNQAKAIEMVRNGSTDMDLHSSFIFSNLNNKFGVLSMPFLFDSAENATAKLDAAGGEVLGALLEDYGIHLLGVFENGMRNLYSNGTLVKNINDLKGMKIRVPAVPIYIDCLTAMGANPISMNWEEVYTALQQGTVDGHENINEGFYNLSFYEVQEYITEWNWSYDPAFMVINKKLWDSFDPEVQKVFTDAAKIAADYQRAISRERARTALNRSVDEGLVKARYVPTPEELAEFKAVCNPIVAKYKAEFGTEFMKAFE